MYVRFMVVLVLCGLMSGTESAAAVLRDIEWVTRPDATQFVVELDGVTRYQDTNRMQDGYFYIDLFRVAPPGRNLSISVDNGVVKAILLVHYEERDVLRLIFYVEAETRYAILPHSNPDRLEVRVLHPPGARVRVDTRGEFDEAPAPLFRLRPRQKKVVVIDPGHGGKDPGAISLARVNGRLVEEKHLTLRTALALKELINKSPNMVARLIREDDRYVSLNDRIELADRFRGDMFISLHYNASQTKPNARGSRGLELYHLNPDLTGREARKISSAAANDPQVRKLLLNMVNERLIAQYQQSRLFCQLLEAEFKQNGYFGRYYRGIKSAGFRSLVRQYNRPSILVEVGFVTHGQELRRMVTESNHRVTAICLFNGINRYFSSQDPKFKPHRIAVPK